MPATAAKLYESNVQIFLEVQNAFDECSPEIQEVVEQMSAIIRDEDASHSEKQLALHTIVDALFPSAGVNVLEVERSMASEPESKLREAELDSEEEFFASRVKELMEERGLTQAQLAEKIGISQPAVANMLGRKCRPQRRTVIRAAEALGVEPKEIWPPLAED